MRYRFDAMRFLVAETFTRSIARLPDEAQRSVKRVAFDLQTNPTQRGLRPHRIVRAVDPGFWSVRVNRDLRIIIHRSGGEVVFCHADHHDAAYAWAEHRRLEHRPAAGTLELVEVVETRQEVAPARERGREEADLGPGPVMEPAPAEPPAGSAGPSEQRRFRTRRRAVAPLAAPALVRSSAGAAAPLAQLLRLAQLRRSASAQAGEPRCAATGGDQRGAGSAASPAREGCALSVKILALALLAAPGPMLASLAATGTAGRGLALAPGVVGALLLVACGVAGSRLAARTAQRALEAALLLRDAVRAGALEVRAEPARVDPGLWPLLRSMNETVDAFAIPFAKSTAALARISRGDLAEPLAEPFRGEFERHREAINAMVGFVLLRAEEIRLLIGSGGATGGGPAAVAAARAGLDANRVPHGDGRAR